MPSCDITLKKAWFFMCVVLGIFWGIWAVYFCLVFGGVHFYLFCCGFVRFFGFFCFYKTYI